MSSDYAYAYYLHVCSRKTIAIPTMHNMGISFRSVLTSAFSNIAMLVLIPERNRGLLKIFWVRLWGLMGY